MEAANLDGWTKAAWRQWARKQVAQMDTKLRIQKEALIVNQLLKNPHFCQATHILLYNALPDEVNLQYIFTHAFNKKLYLPCVQGDMLRIAAYNANQVQGAYGIWEPQYSEEVAITQIDLVLVPGRAFSNDGQRLGRGKGYYDRLLALPNHAYLIGIAYSEQLTDHLPCEIHDKRMNEVVFA